MRKELQSETLIRTDYREDDGNKYTYKLLMRENTKTASFKIPLYSIKLNMTDSDGCETSAGVCDLFADLEKAVRFYERLVKHLATPIDLRYIVEDEIC